MSGLQDQVLQDQVFHDQVLNDQVVTELTERTEFIEKRGLSRIYELQINQTKSYIAKTLIGQNLDRDRDVLQETSIGMYLSHRFPNLFVKHYGISQFQDGRLFIIQEKCETTLGDFYEEDVLKNTIPNSRIKKMSQDQNIGLAGDCNQPKLNFG